MEAQRPRRVDRKVDDVVGALDRITGTLGAQFTT
jgi:hypothetical protein